MSHIEDIQKLTKLERLILSNNLMRHLPKGICALRELQVLDLDGNRLESLVSEISYLRSLKRLNVQSNRITYLPRGLGLVLHCVVNMMCSHHWDYTNVSSSLERCPDFRAC